MDAKTRERGPSGEKKLPPASRPEHTPGSGGSAEAQETQGPPRKRPWRDRLREHGILATVGACVLLVALIGGLAYWLNVRHYESTDDAFVAARSFSVAAKVGGYVIAVPVTDNQHVNAGDLLARIDDRDYRIAVDQAQAQVAVAEANVANIAAQIDSQQAQIDQAKAQLKQAEAQLQFSQQEDARAQDLVQKGAGTVQRAQQTKSDLEAQQANNARAKTAVTDMRPGQPVEIRIDAYPGRKLSGHVESVQPGSGTAFSLLPAENATGNFVKVVQRVPVKIVVDNWSPDVPVGPGMSVVPWTRVR